MKTRHGSPHISSAVLLLTAVMSWAQPTVVACVGNSITAAGDYVMELTAALGLSYQVNNYGFSGACVLRDAESATGQPADSYWGSRFMDSVFARQPDIITIMLGTNDGKYYNWGNHADAFFGDYCDLIDTFRTIVTLDELYVCLPPPCFDPSCCDIVPALVNDSIMPLVDSAARAMGASVIDCHTPLLSCRELFSSDGIHPTYIGGDSLGQIVYAGMTGAAGVRPRMWQARTGCSVPSAAVGLFMATGRVAECSGGAMQLLVAAGTRGKPVAVVGVPPWQRLPKETP